MCVVCLLRVACLLWSRLRQRPSYRRPQAGSHRSARGVALGGCVWLCRRLTGSTSLRVHVPRHLPTVLACACHWATALEFSVRDSSGAAGILVGHPTTQLSSTHLVQLGLPHIRQRMLSCRVQPRRSSALVVSCWSVSRACVCSSCSLSRLCT